MKRVEMSIVIPVYQPQEILFEVLASVVELSQYVSLEIVIVYNGDENYIRLNDICSYIHERDITCLRTHLALADVCNARNVGLSMATGQFVKFLDADDVLISQNVIRQLRLIKETHIDIVTGDYLWRMPSLKTKPRPRRVRTTTQGLISGEIGITSSALFRREKITEIEWKVGKRINEEKEFYRDCLNAGLSFFHLVGPVFLKSYSPRSLSAKADQEGLTTVAVAQFRLQLWKARRRTMSNGELFDCRFYMLESFVQLMQQESLRSARVAIRLLLSGGILMNQLSAKQKIGLTLLTPLGFPMMNICKNRGIRFFKSCSEKSSK